MISFGPKVNRSYSMYIPFQSNNITIEIFFSKTNTYLGFVVPSYIIQASKNGELSCHIFRELKQSSFANTFLDIKDIRTPNLDIKNQFSNILPAYKDKIQYTGNETVKVSKVSTSNGPFDSILYIYIFGFPDFPDDFVYCLAERQHIDNVVNKKIVRTSAIQICSKEAHEDLTKMVRFYNGKTDAELRHEFDDADESLKDIYSGSN